MKLIQGVLLILKVFKAAMNYLTVNVTQVIQVQMVVLVLHVHLVVIKTPWEVNHVHCVSLMQIV